MRSALIAFSLALNALLLTALASPGLGRSVYRHFQSTKQTAADSTANAITTARGQTSPVTWNSLETDDPRALIARLRATGMPPLLIRALVEAKIDRAIALKRAAFRSANPPPPYWNELALAKTKPDLKAAADLRQAERQKLALLDAEFGADTALAERNNPLDHFKYGDLPADKARQAKVIDEDYDELATQISNGMLRVTVPGDRETVARLHAEKEKDLRSVLSPAEYETHLLRSSTTADNLRASLVTFQPTEEEFRAIFRLQQSFDEKYPLPWLFDSPGVASRDEALLRQKEREEVAERIKAALGPERGAEYELESNYTFRQLSQAITQIGIEKSAAIKAWSAQQEFNERAAAMRANRDLNARELGVQGNALRSELTDRLFQVLGGQRGLDVYNRTITTGTMRPLPAPISKR